MLNPPIIPFISSINETLIDRDSFLQQLTDNIHSVLTDGLSDRMEELDSQLKDLEAEIISMAIGGQEYDEMESFVKRHDDIPEYSEVLVRRLIEKVTIFEKNIGVDLKSGVSMAVDI